MQTTDTDRQSLDVTGLPQEAIRALEALVAAWRHQQQPSDAQRPLWQAPYEEWSKALREWANSHPKRDTFADWSRETIYGDDGR
jgi:hypothetical protein